VSKAGGPVTSTALVSLAFFKLKKAIIKALPIVKKVDVPTYAKDIVGDIKQWDERDIIFARIELFNQFGSNSPEYKAYYEAHPEYLEYDAKMGHRPGLGRTGGVDIPMFAAQFEVIAKIGDEFIVDGKRAPEKTRIQSERAAEKVKAFARFLGADMVKIGHLRKEWVYNYVGRSKGDHGARQCRGTPIDLRCHPNAIAMGFQMTYDLIRSDPDFPVLLATAKGYGMGA